MPDVLMPRLSDSMEEGTVVRWLKSDGDVVARGEEIVEIETDKATMTYEADDAGALALEDDAVVVAPCMTLTLVCDHRILDGADGARFLADLRGALEQPLGMLA